MVALENGPWVPWGSDNWQRPLIAFFSGSKKILTTSESSEYSEEIQMFHHASVSFCISVLYKNGKRKLLRRTLLSLARANTSKTWRLYKWPYNFSIFRLVLINIDEPGSTKTLCSSRSRVRINWDVCQNVPTVAKLKHSCRWSVMHAVNLTWLQFHFWLRQRPLQKKHELMSCNKLAAHSDLFVVASFLAR